jgi:hypothetical protein
VEVSEPRMVRHLEARLLQQQKHAHRYRPRYRGEHTPDHITDLYRDVFGSALTSTSSGDTRLQALVVPRVQPPRSALASVGVDALVERIHVDAILTGDFAADLVLRRTLARSDLDVMWTLGLREALVAGRAYLLVWPDAAGEPLISVESPEQVAAHRQPGPPYQVDAALKVLRDEWTGRRRAWLWTDEGVRVELAEQDTSQLVEGEQTSWAEVGRLRSTPMPPVVELADRAELTSEPRSEVARTESLVDAHDVGLGLLLLGMRFGAIPIRTATGLPVPRDENGNPILGPDGKPILQFDHRSDKVWVSTETGTKFDTLAPADLSVLVDGIDAIKREVRAVTAVPAWAVGGDLAGGWTGETVKASESPLVRRARTIMRGLGAATRATSALVLQLAGVPVDPLDVRTVWADPETRLEAQAVDAAHKLASLDGPLVPVLLRRLGWPDEDVRQAVALLKTNDVSARAAQALTGDPDLLAA